MCQFDMPVKLLSVGEQLFKVDSHPLLSSFHYLFERLAYQSLRSSELRSKIHLIHQNIHKSFLKHFRHFLRLDKPLCCTNLDEEEEEHGAKGLVKAGGPIPIQRQKQK